MPFQSAEERMDRLEDALNTFIRHTDQDIAEMREWRIHSQKQWGEIAQKLGTFVEDIVAPNIPRIEREVCGLGCTEEELFSAPRLRMRHPVDEARMREFDYVYATRRGWIVVESKSDPKLRDVDAFRELLAEVREYFPHYASSPLWSIFASLYVPEHVVKYCARHRIFALGMGPETMQLLNSSEILPAPSAN